MLPRFRPVTGLFAAFFVALFVALFVANLSSAGVQAENLLSDPGTSAPATTNVNVTIDALSNRHLISTYVYGGAYPKDASTISDIGLTVVRWGGNATSRYNWKTFTYKAANVWDFEDFGYSEIGDTDSAKYIQDVKGAGSNPLMTMVMLPWVAKSSGWSFSVSKYGAQCSTDPYNHDAGNGVQADCSTNLTADPTDANVALLDQAGPKDLAGSVYRNQWIPARATAFGPAPPFYNQANVL